MNFSSMSLCEPLLAALREEGYETPTPIQARTIPALLEGKDLLGCAQTGTGKTAAFALPILHTLETAPADLTRRGPVLPRALVLSPTRELAVQIADSFAAYGRNTSLNHTVIYGGVSQFHQVKALKRGVDIVVATPGRLIDLMEQRLIDLSAISCFVLDEADRMLDMGFIHPIRRIASVLPKARQTMLFSATMPASIQHLAEALLKNPVKISTAPAATPVNAIAQSVFMVPRDMKPALLEHLLAEAGVERAVVFTKTKFGADRVSKRLNQAGVSSEAIHGNKGQNQRQRALSAFRDGRSRVLVATDVAARGLDVDGVTHVFNYDLPMEPEAYVHRIGRTGRAGAKGIAISFCDSEERGLLRDIERLTGKRIPAAPAPQGLAPAAPRPSVESRPAFESRPAPAPRNAPARPAAPARAPRDDRPQGPKPARRPDRHPEPRHAERQSERHPGGQHGPASSGKSKSAAFHGNAGWNKRTKRR